MPSWAQQQPCVVRTSKSTDRCLNEPTVAHMTQAKRCLVYSYTYRHQGITYGKKELRRCSCSSGDISSEEFLTASCAVVWVHWQKVPAIERFSLAQPACRTHTSAPASAHVPPVLSRDVCTQKLGWFAWCICIDRLAQRELERKCRDWGLGAFLARPGVVYVK